MSTQQTPSLKELQARYPYQFSTPNLGIEIARGWKPLFAQLCADVDQALGADIYGFHWSQIKEKFGSARFYYRFGGDQSDPERQERPEYGHNYQQAVMGVFNLTNEAEERTLSICLACGKEGNRDSTGGYLLVLCPEHKAQRQRSPADQPLIIWESLNDADN